MRQKLLTMGTRIADASMERHLLRHEVKAARVRKAEGVKRGVVADLRGKHSTNCPSCKPLMEANLELQRVASRRRQKRAGRRDSYNFGGVGNSFDTVDRVGEELTPSILKSKYGPKSSSRAAAAHPSYDSDDDASISR